MPFDGLMVRAVVNELSRKIINFRVDRVYQPQKTTLLLRLRQRRNTSSLLISTHPVRHRLHLTEQSYKNPQSPPMFCMVLRKHLEGGIIQRISQPDYERVIKFQIENKNELGQVVKKYLVCEIMGKHSNIILLDSDEETIIDGLKKYSYAVNSYREVLPGVIYKEPPSQDKLSPDAIDEDGFKNQLLNQGFELAIKDALFRSFKGIAPDTCKEIIFRANLSENETVEECGEYEYNNLWIAFKDVIDNINNSNFKPTIVKNNKDKMLDFFPLDLKQYPSEQKEHYPSLSEAIEKFYLSKEREGTFRNLKNTLTKVLTREIKRCSKKANLQHQTVEKAKGAEKYKLYGELVTANIYRIKKGMNEIEVINYYSDDQEKIKIKLKPELTPAENAQRYYKKYNKTASSAKKAKIQLQHTLNELQYLEDTLYWLQNTKTLDELTEIKNELIKGGYIEERDDTNKKKTREIKKPHYLHFLSSDGFNILVGKNNTSNDYLTLKVASGNDLWFHVKDLPGSHVIVRTEKKQIPQKTLEEAALLAAYFSKGHNSSNVPVDYTLKKHVKKPKGSKPGMVIYDNYKTVYVTPSSDDINTILKRKK